MEFVYHQRHKWIGGDLLVNKIYSFVIGDFSCGSYLDLAQCRLICILQCVLKICLVTVLFINKVWWLMCRLDFVGGDLNSRLLIKLLASLEDLQETTFISAAIDFEATECCKQICGNGAAWGHAISHRNWVWSDEHGGQGAWHFNDKSIGESFYCLNGF